MLECEARCEETCRNHSAALENELGFGAEGERSGLEHPLRRGQTEADSPGRAQLAHEFSVGQRIGRGDVDGSRQFVVFDDPAKRADEIAVVHPRDVLLAIPRPSAQSVAYETEQRVERSATIGTHDDRGTEFHFSGQRRVGFVKSALPRLGNTDAEAPRFRNVWLISADDSAAFVVGGVESMRVNRGRTRLQPHPRRPDGTRDCLTDDARRFNAR